MARGVDARPRTRGFSWNVRAGCLIRLGASPGSAAGLGNSALTISQPREARCFASCRPPAAVTRTGSLVLCLEAALDLQNSGLEPYQCWLQRNLIMQRLALLSWAAAAVALQPVPKPQLVQTKAAKRVGAQLAAAVLADASTLPLASLALSADDYDAIYGMSSTGSKGSSIKFEMPSFGGGDDAPDTAAADKKKADDAAAARSAPAAAKAAEREAARARRAPSSSRSCGTRPRSARRRPRRKRTRPSRRPRPRGELSKKEDAAPAAARRLLQRAVFADV